MVQIQFDLPEDLDKKVRIFMAKNNIKDKREGVIEMLRRFKCKEKN